MAGNKVVLKSSDSQDQQSPRLLDQVDIDFQYRQLVIRDAKGQKDRITLLPQNLFEPLRNHLVRVRALHEKDLRDGYGCVYLPFALAQKYPAAGRDWGWQYVFPSTRRSTIRASTFRGNVEC